MCTDLAAALTLLDQQQAFIDELILLHAHARADLKLARALVDHVLQRATPTPTHVLTAAELAAYVPDPPLDVPCVKCRALHPPSRGRRHVCPTCRSAAGRASSTFGREARA